MAQRIENCVDAVAAMLLACAMQFATWKLGLPLLLATGWAALAFLLCFWRLGLVDTANDRFPAHDFTPVSFEPDPPELLLDDILAGAGEQSRVVRLFDPSAASQAAPPDASQALYDALAGLRRSLR